MNAKQLAKIIGKAMKRSNARDTSTTFAVEAFPGTKSPHMTGAMDMAPDELLQFERAGQQAMVDPEGRNIAAKHLGLEELPSSEQKGYFQAAGGTTPQQNPVTEYQTAMGSNKDEELMAKFMQWGLLQDGVASAGIRKGAVPDKGGYSSVMTDMGAPEARKALDAGGFEFDKFGPDGYYLSQGSKGLNVGSLTEVGPDVQRKMAEVLGDGRIHNRPHGGTAYQGAQDFEYTSVADEFANMADMFESQGKGPQLNSMLRDWAPRADASWDAMEGISGGTAAPSMRTITEELNKAFKGGGEPINIILKLKADGKISTLQMDQLMQQFMPQQSQQGLLA